MDRFSRAVSVLERAIESGAMPGASVAVGLDGGIVFERALGTLDGSELANVDTLYDLASLTKPIATASSVLTLIERGDLSLSDSVAHVLGGSFSRFAPMTVKHLLTHTSGLPAWTACYDRGFGIDAALEAILSVPLSGAPGARYEYSCLGFILLSRIVRDVSGERLDRFARARIFDELGADSLIFAPGATGPGKTGNVAPTISREGPGKDTPLFGVVHDGNARGIEADGASVSGNAGLFGTARDVAKFGVALCSGKLFGAPATTRTLENQIPPSVGGHTLLFFAHPNLLTPIGDLLSDTAVGHSGYTGTLLAIEPSRGLVIALCANAVFGDGKADFLRFRRRFLNAIAADL